MNILTKNLIKQSGRIYFGDTETTSPDCGLKSGGGTDDGVKEGVKTEFSI